MIWVLGGFVLIAVGALLRHALQLGKRSLEGASRLAPLDSEREAIYQPLALEVETQASILGISLNDAFDERDSGHHDIAWRLVRLSAGEWNRLAGLVTGLLNILNSRLPEARAIVPFRGISSHRFKSSLMIDYVRMHELLDQLVFSSRLRFQLHLRVLRRAAETLTAEFRRGYRYGERTEDRPEELWRQLDFYFHDFDLIAKESLLALRTLLICLSPLSIGGIAADLKGLIGRGVRAASIPSAH